MSCKIDFVPSKELMELQKVELDILNEFQRICKKFISAILPKAELFWAQPGIRGLFPGMMI